MDKDLTEDQIKDLDDKVENFLSYYNNNDYKI